MSDRHGAKQKHPFDPKKASKLDDPGRFELVPVGEILALLDPPRAGLVVDFGTGTGAYALALAAFRPDLRIAALDEQESLLDLLRRKLADRPQPPVDPVLVGSPAEKALHGKADRVFALNVLHELGDDALKSLGRYLKPNGRILFVDWNEESDRPSGPPRGEAYTPGEAVSHLGRFGYSVDKMARLRFHFALLARPPR